MMRKVNICFSVEMSDENERELMTFLDIKELSDEDISEYFMTSGTMFLDPFKVDPIVAE